MSDAACKHAFTPTEDDLCYVCQRQATRFNASGEGRCATCPDDYSWTPDIPHPSDMSWEPSA